MLSDDIGDVLFAYFQWARIDAPEDIGYPHIESIRRLLGSTVGSIGITEDEALLVNWAMGNLKREKPDSYTALIRVYRDKKTTRWMEARGEGDRRVIARQIAEGREFIRGVLFGAMVSR